MLDIGEIASGFSRSKINSSLQSIVDEINNNVLRRDGILAGENNSMKLDLDMNSNRILNLPVPTSLSEPVRLGDLTDGIDLDVNISVLQDVINVVDYGASPAASPAVNTAAFRAAMDAAKAQNKGFYIPDAGGTFMVNGYTIIHPEVKNVIINGHVSAEGQLPAGFYPDEGELFRRGIFIAGKTTKTLLGSPAANITKGDRNFNVGPNPNVEEGDILLVYDVRDYTFGNFRNVTDQNGDVVWSQTTINSNRPVYHASEFAQVRVVSQSPGNEDDIFTYKLARDDYEAAFTNVYKMDMSEVHISGTGSVTGINDLSPTPIDPSPSPVNREVVPAFLITQCSGTFRGVKVEKCSQMNFLLDLCYNFTVSDAVIAHYTLFAPSDNLHYGIIIGGSENITINNCFVGGMKHAIAVGMSHFESPINRNIIIQQNILMSNYNYAADLHGCTEHCSYESNIIVGGCTISGTENKSSNNLIYSNWDGVCYYISELVTADITIEGDILVNVGRNASTHGVISVGGNSIRGFTAGMRRGGTFLIKDIRFRWNKGVEGVCNISNLDDDQAACEAAGGIYYPEDPLTGQPSYCSVQRPEDQVTCEAAPFNGTWEPGGYNAISIRNRGYPGDDIRVVLENLQLDTDNSYNYIYIDNIPDNEGLGYYQGVDGRPINRVEIKNLDSVGGGVTVREVENLFIKDANIRKAARRGIEIRDVTDEFVLQNIHVSECGLAGVTYINDVNDPNRCRKGTLINVTSVNNNTQGITTPVRDRDAAISVNEVEELIIENLYGEMDTLDAVQPANVPISIRFIDKVISRGKHRGIFQGVEETLAVTYTDIGTLVDQNTLEVPTITGTSYTLSDLDQSKFLVFDNASDVTVNLPEDVSTGNNVLMTNIGAGGIILNPTGLATLRGATAITDPTGCLAVIKLSDLTYQTTER